MSFAPSPFQCLENSKMLMVNIVNDILVTELVSSHLNAKICCSYGKTDVHVTLDFACILQTLF